MVQNFRHFKAGPDPSGCTWDVDFLWLQTAIAIRHSDSVDVKFLLSGGGARIEKVIALPHPGLLELSRETGRALTDPWCMELAALHLMHMVETGGDLEKAPATVTAEELAKYDAMLAA